MTTPQGVLNRDVGIVPRKTQLAQVAATVLLRSLGALRWLVWIAIGNACAAALLGLDWLPQAPWWLIALGWLLLITPPGRMALSALGARLILRGVTPGHHPRGGKVHLKVWLAEHLEDALGATNLAGAPFIKTYARALGARVAKDVDLHSLPPITGMLDLGPARRCCPVPTSARTPRSRPARPSSVSSPRTSPGRERRPCRAARPADPGPTRPRPATRPGKRHTPSRG
jgi:hypothetical protein